MEKYQLYMLRLEDAKIIPSKMWFDDIYTAMEYCVLKNRAQVELNVEQYYYFYFYSFYSDFKAFNSQEDLRDLALKKLERWNDELNKLKALYMVATKSLLQGGLNKKEAV